MKTQKQRGFTIIEVVLVLAIAGLIFLVVFLAVPALQSGQRDQQRTSDLSRLQTAIENYRSNNKGTLPTFTTTFINSYLASAASGETFNSPGGDQYVFSAWPSPSTTTNTIPVFSNQPSPAGNNNVIYYVTGRKCGTAEGTVTNPSGTRDYAVAMPLEGGGVSCHNN